VPETVAEALHLIQHQPPASRVLAGGGGGTVNRWLPAPGLHGLAWPAVLECALTSAESFMGSGRLC
jgi:hypothetical protein